MTTKASLYLYISWILTSVSFLGSICLGEFLENYPCMLCWAQRLCLFPLAAGLGLIYAKQDFKAIYYFIPFSIVGLILSLYHVALQEIPSLDPTLVCGMGPSCLYKPDIGLGKITMPMLSLFSFFITTVILSHVKKITKIVHAITP